MTDSPDQLVPASDLATWMGVEFDDDDTARAAYIIRVVSGWAREVSGKLWLNSDDPNLPVTVKGIVLAASRREFENPRHVTYEVHGPESASYSDKAYPPGFFNDPEEKFLLRFRATGGVSGLFSVGTRREDWDFTLGYIRVLGFDKPIPYFNPGDPGWYQAEHL